MQLSKRLMAIADMIPSDATVCDVGTDHAYLPIYLATRGTHPQIIATELSAGPIARALSHVCEHGMEHRVELRMGDGLDPIQPGEVDTLVLAGMGGATMVEILNKGKAHLPHIKHLVLQPMGSVGAVRRWLDEAGFYAAAEDLVLEEGKYYEIIHGMPGQESKAAPMRFIVGPRLLDSFHPLLEPYIRDQIRHWQQIRDNVSQGKGDDMDTRLQEINDHLQLLEGAIAWLQK